MGFDKFCFILTLTGSMLIIGYHRYLSNSELVSDIVESIIEDGDTFLFFVIGFLFLIGFSIHYIVSWF